MILCNKSHPEAINFDVVEDWAWKNDRLFGLRFDVARNPEFFALQSKAPVHDGGKAFRDFLGMMNSFKS